MPLTHIIFAVSSSPLFPPLACPPYSEPRVQKRVSFYVAKCPFHVFDMKRGRNISRDELKGDISAALKPWLISHGDYGEYVDNRASSLRSLQKEIKRLGRYGILSHRWDVGQELAFTDNLLDPTVQEKTGFHKLRNFAMVLKSQFQCRYLWMDTLCIGEDNRNESIPLMFGWYHNAHICIIYLTSPCSMRDDPWFTRGWTLQEFLAARHIKVFQRGKNGSSAWRSWPGLSENDEFVKIISGG